MGKEAQFISSSAKAGNLKSPWLTVFTATYNRCGELNRLYRSMQAMYAARPAGVEMEWLVVDDGSTDGTRGQIERWCRDNLLPVRYFCQPNQGKHVAFNSGVAVARGEMFISVDSDDTLLPSAFRTFYDTWQSIPVPEREGLKGVTGRCVDPATGKIIGSPLPRVPLVTSPQDLRLRYKVKGEMCGFNRTEILRRYPFPVEDGGTRFMPEAIVWFSIGMKYKEYVIDTPVREYFSDGNGAITAGDYRTRSAQNYYLWRFEVNNIVSRYLFRAPKEMLKAVVGLSMDGFRTGRSAGAILADCHTVGCKLGVLSLMWAGWLLSKR